MFDRNVEFLVRSDVTRGILMSNLYLLIHISSSSSLGCDRVHSCIQIVFPATLNPQSCDPSPLINVEINDLVMSWNGRRKRFTLFSSIISLSHQRRFTRPNSKIMSILYGPGKCWNAFRRRRRGRLRRRPSVNI